MSPPGSKKITNQRSRTDMAESTAGNMTGSQLFSGIVSGYIKGNEICKVVFKEDGQTHDIDCIWAAGFMSSLLGFKTNYSPPIGSSVVVFAPTPSKGYILGASPSAVFADHYGVARKVTSGGEKETDSIYYNQQGFTEKLRQKHTEGQQQGESSNEHYWSGNPPVDLVEGEVDMSNAMGVGMQMMKHFAILSAGDLAKVETSVIDDMVRIISHTFRHFSAFGDYKIYNDGGRLNVIWDGTTNDWEAAGEPVPGKERAKKDGEALVDVEKDRFKEDARWRFSSYIGFLGDFINLFVTDQLDPTQGDGKRSGKGRVHINEDGSILAQSVGDIILERVCRISVPIKLKPEFHPEGDGALSNGELPEPKDKEPITAWDWNESGGVEQSFWGVYQLRDYGRWFSNYYSKARFHQLKKDWKVPSESEVPKPEKQHSGEEDKKSVSTAGNEEEVEVYSCIRMFRDGSISLLDGYENSVTLSRSGVNISSATNLQLEAAGSVNIVAGRDVNVVGRNSTDISALKGGVSIRGQNFIQQYSPKGGILLETDQNPLGPVYVRNDIDKPDVGQVDPRKINGIVLWARKGCMRLLSGYDMGLRSERGHQIFSGMMQHWKSKAGFINFNNQLILAGEVAFLKGLLWTTQFIAKKIYTGNDYKSIFDHPGHIIGDNDLDKIKGPPEDLFKMSQHITDAFEKREWDAMFKYREKKDLGTEGDLPRESSALYESLTQQGLRMNASNTKLKPGDSYTDWDPAKDGEIEDRRSNWPGIGKQHFVLPSADNDKLWQPSSETEFKNHSTELTLEDFKLKRLI